MLSAAPREAAHTMSVLDRLATALDRRDEAPNVELAEELARNDPRSLARVVEVRLAGIHQPAKRKRLAKVLRKLAAM